MATNISCPDRERIFMDGTPDEWAALENHAAGCTECAEELRAWKFLSVAAKELRAPENEASLWPRIRMALAEEQERKARHPSWLRWFDSPAMGWQTALAAACLVVITTSVVWFYRAQSNHNQPPDQATTRPLLKENALKEVERAEADYVKAIDKLAAEAKPELANPSTPLMVSYREKLAVLDSAIDELRAEAGQNPSNAHLRRQLLAMYQEKEQTLEEMVEEKR